MKTLWQVLLATLILSLSQALVGALLFRPAGGRSEGTALFLLANALTAMVLVLLAQRLPATGAARVGLLFAVPGGIQANNLVEAAFFHLGIPGPELMRILLFQLLLAAVLALALGRLVAPAPAMEPPRGGRGVWSWAARIAASDLAYVVAYFAAGTAIFPYVREFYAARPLPSPPAVLAMQVGRGLVFTGIVLLIVRRLIGSRRALAALSGLTLSVPGGIAPLLVPNPYLPDAVRFVHLGEVGVSNFLFGLLAGWLLGSAPGGAKAPVAAAVQGKR